MGALRIPTGMSTPRFRADRMVEVEGGLANAPQIVPGDPEHKLVKRRLVAKTRVFNLLDPQEVLQHEEVWQLVADGEAKVSNPVLQPVYVEGKGLLAYLRWCEFEYLLPGARPTNRNPEKQLKTDIPAAPYIPPPVPTVEVDLPAVVVAQASPAQ